MNGNGEMITKYLLHVFMNADTERLQSHKHGSMDGLLPVLQ